MKIVRSKQLTLEPAGHEDPNDPGVVKKVLFHLHDLARGDIQMVNWAVLYPNRSFSAHTHRTMQEVFIIVSGRVIASIDGQDVLLEKGDALVAEPGETHTMKNVTTRTARFIAIGIVS
ncbi:MAG TPA: cupin domain-containing protein [Patescibacteria group bacterium]|jgi:mannose-6-phosphate isomerase-like protein (cupin superfamily)|nr:cupin domain-containing protein [Patescibacteria group bacterium]